MARYIDADALITKGWRLERHAPNGMVISEMSIADVPTADVAEVRHGRWIINDEDYWTKCSVCEFEYFDEQEDIYNTYRYCPHCGARMGGDEE